MKKILTSIAVLGLLLTILPAILLIAGLIKQLPTAHHLMIAGMLLWFAANIPLYTLSRK